MLSLLFVLIFAFCALCLLGMAVGIMLSDLSDDDDDEWEPDYVFNAQLYAEANTRRWKGMR